MYDDCCIYLTRNDKSSVDPLCLAPRHYTNEKELLDELNGLFDEHVKIAFSLNDQDHKAKMLFDEMDGGYLGVLLSESSEDPLDLEGEIFHVGNTIASVLRSI